MGRSLSSTPPNSEPPSPVSYSRTMELVAIILAVGLATALNLLTLGILYDALFHSNSAGISENATQILTGWGGGIIGVVGAFVGYRAGGSTGGQRASDRRVPDA